MSIEKFTKPIAILIIVVGVIVSTGIVLAQNETNIIFPVPELGNCIDKESCKAYCDKPANADSCLDFARKNGLMHEEELKVAEIILRNGGPGGCKSWEECEAFCDSIDNIDQCISFAEKNNLIPSG